MTLRVLVREPVWMERVLVPALCGWIARRRCWSVPEPVSQAASKMWVPRMRQSS